MEKTKFKESFFTVLFLFVLFIGTEGTTETTEVTTETIRSTPSSAANTLSVTSGADNTTFASDFSLTSEAPSNISSSVTGETVTTGESTTDVLTYTPSSITSEKITRDEFTTDVLTDSSSVSGETITLAETTADVLTDASSVTGEIVITNETATDVFTDAFSSITDETESSSLIPVTEQVTQTAETGFVSESDGTVESGTEVTDGSTSLNTESSTSSELSSESPTVDFSSASDSFTDVTVLFTRDETDLATVTQTDSSSEISTEDEQQSTSTEEITTYSVTLEVEATTQKSATANATMEITTGATTANIAITEISSTDATKPEQTETTAGGITEVYSSVASEETTAANATSELSETPSWTTEETSTLNDTTNQDSTVVESSTVTRPTSTTLRSTTTTQSLDNEPDLEGKTTKIFLTLLWPELPWGPDLLDTSTERYQEFTAELETKMYEIYRSTYGFVALSFDEFRALEQNRNLRKKRQAGSKGIFSKMKNSYSLEAVLINDTLIAESILDSLPDLSKMTLGGTNADETYINETLTENLKEQFDDLGNLSQTICRDDSSLCAPSEYCLVDPTKEIGITCQYKCFQYDCKEKQGISNAYCYVDDSYELSCGCNPETLDTGSNCLSQWWIVGFSVGVAVILIGVFTTIIIVLVIRARRNNSNSIESEPFIFEDQHVPSKRKRRLNDQISESEVSFSPAYDENYHDNGAAKNGKIRSPNDVTFAYSNTAYDKDIDRISLDSNDPQYQDISKMLPLQSFSPRLDLVDTKESFLIPRATLEKEMDSSYFS